MQSKLRSLIRKTDQTFLSFPITFVCFQYTISRSSPFGGPLYQQQTTVPLITEAIWQRHKRKSLQLDRMSAGQQEIQKSRYQKKKDSFRDCCCSYIQHSCLLYSYSRKLRFLLIQDENACSVQRIHLRNEMSRHIPRTRANLRFVCQLGWDKESHSSRYYYIFNEIILFTDSQGGISFIIWHFHQKSYKNVES